MPLTEVSTLVPFIYQCRSLRAKIWICVVRVEHIHVHCYTLLNTDLNGTSLISFKTPFHEDFTELEINISIIHTYSTAQRQLNKRTRVPRVSRACPTRVPRTRRTHICTRSAYVRPRAHRAALCGVRTYVHVYPFRFEFVVNMRTF